MGPISRKSSSNNESRRSAHGPAGRRWRAKGRSAAAVRQAAVVDTLESRRLLSGALAYSVKPQNALSEPADAVVPVGAPVGIPILHSFPGAPVKLYLDFDGQPATDWTGTPVPPTPAYSVDNDAANFSAQELTNIQEIWARVAEKYSPFNVDVTTQDPGALIDGQSLKVVIGGFGQWIPGAGGVAYLGAFRNFASNIAWVFSAQAPNNLAFVSEATAHEAGHEFGLEHQSLYNGNTLVQQYNPGNAQRAPIMGNSYSSQRGLWWVGPTPNGVNDIQDDLAILSGPVNGFGYRADDHGNSAGAATLMDLTALPDVTGTGIIETVSDVDYLAFPSQAGTVNFTVTPAAAGPMLDLTAQIVDINGAVIANGTKNGLGVTFTNVTIPSSGQYFVRVASVGNQGDIGQYTVSGTIDNPGPVVAGRVWEDSNGDGIRQVGEPALAGVTVNLMGLGGDNLPGTGDDSVVASTQTLGSGQYAFISSPGTYYVRVDRPSGTVLSPSNQGPDDTRDSDINFGGASDVFTLVSSLVSIDAGFKPTDTRVGDLVFDDVNNNGILDAGEFGVDGAVIELWRAGPDGIAGTGDDALAGTTTTAGGGKYQFTKLDDGVRYFIKLKTPPAGYSPSAKDQGSDDARDSDVDPTTRLSDTFVLSQDQQDFTRDIGVHLPVVTVAEGRSPEGNTGDNLQMSFTFHLSEPSTQTVRVRYTTVQQSALAGVDFVPVASGEVVIDPGKQDVTLPLVTLIGDNVIEPDKVFFVNLTGADFARLGQDVVRGVIVNDEALALAVDDTRAQVVESPDGSVAYFYVTLPGPSGTAVTVNYTIKDGTAVGATRAEVLAGTKSLSQLDYVTEASGGTLTFAPGETSKVVAVRILPDFVNELTEFFTLELSSPSGATIGGTGVGTARITNLQVRQVEFASAGRTYTDNTGNTVTLELNGPGAASVQLMGNGASDAVRISLSGTTEQTKLTIRTARGQTAVYEIVSDGALGSINAPTTNLTGNITIPGGLGNLRLNAVLPLLRPTVPGLGLLPGSQIVVGSTPTGGVTGFSATIGRVADLTLNSGIPIKSLKVASLNDMDGSALTVNTISAPSIGSISASGDFTGNVTTNDLGSLNVGGALKGAEVRAAASIGSVSARAMYGSRLYAGVSQSVTGLPTDAQQFAGGSIKSVNLKGGKAAVFSNSVIAAGSVGTANLGTVASGNSGVPLGVAGLRVASVRGAIAGVPFVTPKNPLETGTVFSDQDFKVVLFA